MDKEQLILQLEELRKIPSSKWINGLDERKSKELEFHNRDRDRRNVKAMDQDTYDKFYANKKFYTTVQKSSQYCEKWIADNAVGKIFLDYACGNGENAIKAAMAGASLSIGFDISDISVRNAEKDARELKLDNTIFFQADAENTKLPDNCVDVILCSGMLHHLDLSYAFPELRRILAPGGKVLAIEALDYNPFIKLYRHRTPSMRTDWEKKHILGLKDINFAKYFFDIGEIKYWHLTSYLGAYLPDFLPLFDAIDTFLVKLPGVKLMSWIFTFELISKDEYDL